MLNVAHHNFSAETIPANRKTQSFKFRGKLCYFVPDWCISAFKRSFHYILHAERSARQFLRQINPCKSQNVIFQIFYENSVNSVLIEIYRRLNAHSTPIYTLNVVHDCLSAEPISANRKTQSFKFRRNTVNSFLIVIYPQLNVHSTPFYQPNVAHDNFSAEIIPANSKTQSFKFRPKLC
jgi:hypothetical protein